MFDLATAKERLNILDNTQDVKIQAALDAVVAAADRYCNRLFLFAHETETLYVQGGHRHSLSRFPLTTLTSVKHERNGITVDVVQHTVDLKAGLVYVNDVTFGSVVFDYEGGYHLDGTAPALPLDLEMAFWGIFDVVWASASGGSISAGGIKKFAITGVGSVEYEGQSGAVTSSGGIIPAIYRAILDMYQRIVS